MFYIFKAGFKIWIVVTMIGSHTNCYSMKWLSNMQMGIMHNIWPLIPSWNFLEKQNQFDPINEKGVPTS